MCVFVCDSKSVVSLKHCNGKDSAITIILDLAPLDLGSACSCLYSTFHPSPGSSPDRPRLCHRTRFLHYATHVMPLSTQLSSALGFGCTGILCSSNISSNSTSSSSIGGWSMILNCCFVCNVSARQIAICSRKNAPTQSRFKNRIDLKVKAK